MVYCVGETEIKVRIPYCGPITAVLEVDAILLTICKHLSIKWRENPGEGGGRWGNMQVVNVEIETLHIVDQNSEILTLAE
jgi:hypothetical protein